MMPTTAPARDAAHQLLSLTLLQWLPEHLLHHPMSRFILSCTTIAFAYAHTWTRRSGGMKRDDIVAKLQQEFHSTVRALQLSRMRRRFKVESAAVAVVDAELRESSVDDASVV